MNLSSIKILLFDGSFKTTAFINRLASGLAERHEVYIAGFNEELPTRLPNVNYVPLGSNQNKIRFVKTALYWSWQQRSFMAFVNSFKALLKGDKSSIQQQNLAAALVHIKPDIIHLQWTSVIPYFESVLRKQEIPVILSQRGFHTNVKPFVYSENMEYLREYYPLFAGFHSVSKSVVNNGDKIWHGPSKINGVVYTGLPLEEWLFSNGYQKKEQIKILSIGRNHWKKGNDYALQACKLLKEKGLSFEYTIIGAAGDEELQFLRADLGLEKEVVFLEQVPIGKVKEIMSEASLLLMPSVEEGVPNVAVEAMAIGCPVIGFGCDGLPELIENGKEGWLVPVRDVEAMAEAVMRFREMNLEEIEGIRKNARHKVEIQHSEEGMISGMERLYIEVLGRFHAEGAEFSAEYAERNN